MLQPQILIISTTAGLHIVQLANITGSAVTFCKLYNTQVMFLTINPQGLRNIEIRDYQSDMKVGEMWKLIKGHNAAEYRSICVCTWYSIWKWEYNSPQTPLYEAIFFSWSTIACNSSNYCSELRNFLPWNSISGPAKLFNLLIKPLCNGPIGIALRLSILTKPNL